MADMRKVKELNSVFLQIAKYYEEAAKLDWVSNKIQYALYQTWLDHDEAEETNDG